jgi:hypothetical protein
MSLCLPLRFSGSGLLGQNLVGRRRKTGLQLHPEKPLSC